MNENKVKLSLTLSADNREQMLALSIFASALAGDQQVASEPVATSYSLSNSLDAYQPNSATVSTTGVELTNAEPTEEEKPKRRRRTAAEMKADNSAESEPAEAAESDPAEAEQEEAEETPAPRTSKITLDDVRRAVSEKKDRHLQIMKFKLREDFGVTKTPDLADHQYEAFYNFLQSLD